MKKQKIVLYHAYCADGFGAALCAWLHFGEDAVQYIPVSYVEPLPPIPDDAEVYILDFSYSREVLQKLANRVSKLVVLDHHQTAEAELSGRWEVDGNCEFDIRFSKKESGAMMAWDYFFPNGSCPPLINYIQDRDLWQWKLPESREVSAALALEPKDFRTWADLDVGTLRIKGRTVLEVMGYQCNKLCRHSIAGDYGGAKFRMVNTPILQSEVCSELLSRDRDLDFAVAWYEAANGEMRYSLRSRKAEGFDVSVIAERYGGGGHASAAGFVLPAGVSWLFCESVVYEPKTGEAA